MKELRFGIAGSGFMGLTHAEALRQCQGAQLVALAGESRAAKEAQVSSLKRGGGGEPRMVYGGYLDSAK